MLSPASTPTEHPSTRQPRGASPSSASLIYSVNFRMATKLLIALRCCVVATVADELDEPADVRLGPLRFQIAAPLLNGSDGWRLDVDRRPREPLAHPGRSRRQRPQPFRVAIEAQLSHF
jgi:hypothetical protein